MKKINLNPSSLKRTIFQTFNINFIIYVFWLFHCCLFQTWVKLVSIAQWIFYRYYCSKELEIKYEKYLQVFWRKEFSKWERNLLKCRHNVTVLLSDPINVEFWVSFEEDLMQDWRETKFWTKVYFGRTDAILTKTRSLIRERDKEGRRHLRKLVMQTKDKLGQGLRQSLQYITGEGRWSTHYNQEKS